MSEKKKIQNCTDSQIVEFCNEKTGQNCSSPRWVDLKDEYIETNNGILAIAVDMTRSPGHVRVFDAEEQQVDMVGGADRGYTVIILVEGGYRYACFGQCCIAMVKPEAT